MYFDVENKIKDIIGLFDKVISTFEKNEQVIKGCEEELSDLQHEIELSKNKGVYHGYLMYVEIRELLRERRKAKDENEKIEALYNYCKNQKQTQKEFQRILSNYKNIEQKHQSRSYQPKRRADLTITKAEPKVNKPFDVLLGDFKKQDVERKKYSYL